MVEVLGVSTKEGEMREKGGDGARVVLRWEI